jgi:general secretion pathway protein A
MYEQHWKLREAPFKLTPDPRFLYLSGLAEDSLLMLQYALLHGRGASMLYGEIGLGKTTMTRRLFELVDQDRMRIVSIVNPVLTPAQVLREVLSQLDISTTERSRQPLVNALHKRLYELYDLGQKVLLVVDEAHLMTNRLTFEELRLMLNCQVEDEMLISLLLVGQTELLPRIEKVPALEQRIGVRCRLKPLTVGETEEMMLHRMKVAGFPEEKSPFTPDAIHLIHRSSEGAPRVILQLADLALFAGMKKRTDLIDGFLVHDLIQERMGAAA